MATLEHEQLIRGGLSHPREHHVFVSAGGRRQQALRGTGLVAGALALVWLVALGLALAGSTRLPGLPVPVAKAVAVPDASATASSAPRHSRAHTARAGASRPQPSAARPAAAAASPVRTTAAAAAVPPATRAAPAAAVTSAAAQAQTGAAPTQGWARRGWTAPPGRTKRSVPTPRGARRPTDTTTTSTTHGNGHGKG